MHHKAEQVFVLTWYRWTLLSSFFVITPVQGFTVHWFRVSQFLRRLRFRFLRYAKLLTVNPAHWRQAGVNRESNNQSYAFSSIDNNRTHTENISCWLSNLFCLENQVLFRCSFKKLWKIFNVFLSIIGNPVKIGDGPAAVTLPFYLNQKGTF